MSKIIEALFALLPWVMLIIGFTIRDPYVFAGGGLLILVETIQDGRR